MRGLIIECVRLKGAYIVGYSRHDMVNHSFWTTRGGRLKTKAQKMKKRLLMAIL